ncbi:sn-glycerol-3-phosphate transport system permease protein UgpA [Agrobacterium rosae]|uniref:sn-glycerol-3-phosphate transport system permease protein UgpA n=1 Tax=Agrobacterium rosae TaxID=1972867 RepID=A0A1R3U3B4_9HYPH|nr:sn-glycerol-3-phosphate transport system permease protein UgpA [Agrobacterium rosae]
MQSVIFPNKVLPYLLVAPQIVLTVVFFFWPASQALYQSTMREDPFGLSSNFVGMANFSAVLSDPNYLHALRVTVVFSLFTALVSMGLALLLATAADRVVRGKGFYRTLMIMPYAVAPAVAGMLWLFMFNPAMGTFAYLLRRNGIDWDPLLDGNQAMLLVVAAAAWKQISYNFLFFVAGLQAIPKSLLEAASIDGARGSRRFWTIVFPLLARRRSSCWSSTPSTPSSTPSASSIRHRRRSCQGHGNVGLQGLQRRFRQPEPRLVGGAIRHSDDHRHCAHRVPVSVRGKARALRLR